jgi:hypothetical protein
VTTGVATAVQEDAPRARVGGILREIAVGGLAAIIAGVVVGGIGGRLVMRLATLLAPDTVGRLTANGNRIGTFTVDGSLLLLFFGGAVAGVVAASIWVVARPWLPTRRSHRALASVPLVLAFGTPLLIEAENPDFDILGHDPVIVAALIVLVAITGPFTVVLDDWLGRRLPTVTSGREPAFALYALVAVIGVLLTAAMTVPLLFQLGGFLAIPANPRRTARTGAPRVRTRRPVGGDRDRARRRGRPDRRRARARMTYRQSPRECGGSTGCPVRSMAPAIPTVAETTAGGSSWRWSPSS